MKRLYKFGIWSLLICLGSVTCNAQVGITKTERSNPKGIVTFAESSTISGISSSKHIDGYVRKLGHSVFTYPVGHLGFYRPFAAESDGTTGAYFRGDPGQAVLPAGSPFNRNTRDSSLNAVSSVEYWDVIGTEPTKLTLSWNDGSDLTSLTGGSVDLVTIAGWSKSNARWEKIASLRDQTSITGGTSTILTGSVTSVQAVDLKNYSAFTLGSGLSESVASNFEGVLESVANSEIKGWVWDQSYPNADLTIELYEGQTVYATVKANAFRSDLKDDGKGTGYYGFKISTPATLKDGKAHQLSARIRGSAFILSGSPKQVSYLFEGQMEILDCYRIRGWVWDKQNPNSTIDVEMVEGGIVRATISASQFRQDLSSAGKGSGNYGFEIALPTSLRDGKPHQFDFRVKGSLYSLVGSPKSINCSTSQFYGSINVLDCSTVQGWVWDKSYPDSSLTIELYEGSTVHATVVANAYRADVKSAGYGTGNYGFSFAL
ncbi:hypothetical protein LXM24_20620, partial [Dyadobacter sp. CY399]|nr:hypothetical protein [Dyadobacter fanqingshengii]